MLLPVVVLVTVALVRENYRLDNTTMEGRLVVVRSPVDGGGGFSLGFEWGGGRERVGAERSRGGFFFSFFLLFFLGLLDGGGSCVCVCCSAVQHTVINLKEYKEEWRGSG